MSDLLIKLIIIIKVQLGIFENQKWA